MMRLRLFCISLLLGGITLQAGGQGREAAFSLSDHPLAAALDSLHRWYAVSIIYLDKDVEGIRVTASSSGCTFDKALRLILAQTTLEAHASGTQIILRQKPAEEIRPSSVIAGTVTDAIGGHRLAGASVVLRSLGAAVDSTVVRRCGTNAFGFYSLQRVPTGDYRLEIRSVGFQPAAIPVRVDSPVPLTRNVALMEESIPLEEVTIEGQRMTNPVAGGLSRGIFVRSAPPDQNEYLLDGARIYNPAHYGGVLSSFHPEALNDIDISTSGLPPSYGGRIGGILDLSLRDGSRERLSGSIGAGFLGTHAAIEGPLGSASTFLVSGRRGYPDAAVPNLADHGIPSRLGSLELITKLSHRVSGNAHLSLSGYLGSDRYNNHTASNGAAMSNTLGWGNTTLNLQWVSIASPSVFLHAAAVYTHYNLALEHTLSGIPALGSLGPLNSRYAIDDIAVRAHAEHYYDEHHTMRGGVEVVRHGITGSLSSLDTQLGPYTPPAGGIWELSLYLQDRWLILQGVQAELGARATTFTSPAGSFSAIDPRFSLLFELSETSRLYTSVTSVNQFLHPYRNSGVFQYYPTVFWYPSGAGITPTTSLRLTLGGQQEIPKASVMFSAEGFYRAINNLHEVRWIGGSSLSAPLTDYMITGSGKTYGIDATIEKRTGRFNGSLSYTVSWTDQLFTELNRGAAFRPQFDRRHEVHASLAFMPDDNWIVSMLAVLAAGETGEVTVASSANAPRYEMDRGGVGVSPSMAIGVIDVNGSRFPGFQRLELQALYRFTLGGIAGQASLQLINGYGLLDPFAWELHQHPDPRLSWSARLKDIRLFPLFPVAGLTFRF